MLTDFGFIDPTELLQTWGFVFIVAWTHIFSAHKTSPF